MFKKTFIDYKSAGSLNQLVLDYLEKNEGLKPFYNFFPDVNGCSQWLENLPYQDLDRNQLSDVLSAQSKTVNNTHELTGSNIALLKNKNVYTVTTGHQLCLFTGPLYFVYKIFSAINLAGSLKEKFPQYDFVPVYWMASEDHDFEEISSFTSGGRTVKWNSKQTGAVGHFDTAELRQLLPELRETLGISQNANYLYSLFDEAYLKHNSLSSATRYLVNELFGKYGLVTIDGDDATFKRQAKTVFEKDIFGSEVAGLVNHSIKKLKDLGYHAQVNPRDINCFYIEPGLRARIEKKEGRFFLSGTERSFSENELKHILAEEPGKISPNVVLRPVFQQMILPNLAYVGGPGELAYWLEFKNMFDNLNVNFPVLVPRSFLTVVDNKTITKIDQVKLTVPEFFKTTQALTKYYLSLNHLLFDLDPEKEKIMAAYKQIAERVNDHDKTLNRHVDAQLQKSLRMLDNIAGKTNRAIKRKSEVELNRIAAVKESLFPGNVPQERVENFSSFYIQYGPSFLDTLKASIDPIKPGQMILSEQS